MAEDLVLEEDLLGHLLRAADEVRAAQGRAPASNCGAGHRRPAALAADPVHHRREGGEGVVGGGLRRLGDEAVRVDAERRPRRGRPRAAARRWSSAKRREALRLAADDRERHRQAERAGARRPTAACRRRRPRPAAGPGPAAGRRRGRRSARRWRPDQVTRSRSRSGEQQLELLGEQLVVVVEVVAEQREGLDERAAPGHDLGPAAGEQVERREVLEDADGIVRAEDADRARQPDALRARARRRPSTTAGAETAKSGRWCSPTPKTSSPTWSASSISSSRSRSRCCGLIVGPSRVRRQLGEGVDARAPSGPEDGRGAPANSRPRCCLIAHRRTRAHVHARDARVAARHGRRDPPATH